MRRLWSALALSLPLLFANKVVQAESFRVLSSWDGSYVQTQVVEQFLEKLKTASEGQIELQMFGPETVPPFEQLDSATGGLMDMLYTNGAYHNNVTTVGLALDGLFESTPDKLRSSGLWELVDEYYQGLGLKLIAVFPDLNGYSLTLKEPLSDDGAGLEGRRIRGTPSYHGVIEYLGAAPVVIPGNEIYPALERGVVDGAGWPTVGPVSMRLYEVADYYLRPTFGQVSYILFMNLERWEGLDPAMQALIAEQAEIFEQEAMEHFLAVGKEEERILEDNGMQVTELSEERHAGVSRAWFETAMGFADEQDANEIDIFQKMAKDNGMNLW